MSIKAQAAKLAGSDDRSSHSSAESSGQSPATPIGKGDNDDGFSISSSKLVESLSNAAIVDHETRYKDKRFTVYKIELACGSQRFTVFHRYTKFLVVQTCAFAELFLSIHPLPYVR